MDTNLRFYGDPYLTTSDILLGTMERPKALSPSMLPSTTSTPKYMLYSILVRLSPGVFVSSFTSPAGKPPSAPPPTVALSKLQDLASHRAFVTSEWWTLDNKLIGFQIEYPASIHGDELENDRE
ncbi:hypothetical protein Dimus_003394 [Dionaea muscipula]